MQVLFGSFRFLPILLARLGLIRLFMPLVECFEHGIRQIVAWVNVERNKAFFKDQIIPSILANVLDERVNLFQDWLDELPSPLPRLILYQSQARADIAAVSSGYRFGCFQFGDRQGKVSVW